MKRPMLSTIAAAAIGAIAGAVFGCRWIALSQALGGPATHLAHAAASEPAWLGAVAALTAWLSWELLPFASGIARPIQTRLLLATSGALAVCLLASRAAAVLGIGADAWTTGLTPSTLVSAAVQYKPLPLVPGSLAPLTTFTIPAALAGAFAALIARAPIVRCTLQGAGVGLALGMTAALAQAVTCLATMGSGHDPRTTLLASMLVWSSACAAAALARYGRTNPRFHLVRIAPALVLAAAAEYVFVATYGAPDYHRLKALSPSNTTAYVHFQADGSRRRTLDQSGNPTLAEKATTFLAAYPHSAYRPAAMLAAAEDAFQRWEFSRSSRLLRKLRLNNPNLDGYASILLALSDLAARRPKTILEPTDENSRFAQWRRTAGAQLSALAAERLGQTARARGYHSDYLDYMLRAPGTCWTSTSVAFSRTRLTALATAPLSTARAIVSCRVVAAGQPVPGVRIALVQPHYDAALPRDSRQFTGAWSVPAWGAHWAETDARGCATIHQVPYGDYEVVVGLTRQTTPRDRVISSTVPVAHVASPRTTLAAVQLAPALRQLSPADGARLKPDAALTWEPYAGATAYSVTVLSLGDGRAARDNACIRERAVTCWARSGIKTTSVTIDRDHFLDGRPRLRAGVGYMWVVYAYGQNGRLISSSEHYFDLRERMFVVGNEQGGKPQ